MDKYTATEQAYKHGYEKGYEAGKKDATDNDVGCKWIPIADERKPKQLQECLCICAFENDLNWQWQCVLRWHDIPYQDNGYVNRPHFTDEGINGMVVTHWMPLQKPPQEE